jgi:hypothetical protein
LRALNISDESNRKILAIEIDASLLKVRVICTPEKLGEIYALLQTIRLAKGPKLRSAALVK